MNAQMAPLLEPPIARSLPFFDSRMGRPSAVFFGFYLRQQFFQQEAGVIVAQAIVFIAAVKAVKRVLVQGGDSARRDENANGHRHFTTSDQLIKNRRRIKLDVVLIDINARRLSQRRTGPARKSSSRARFQGRSCCFRSGVW